MSQTVLERCVRVLLRAYPPDYRRRRGEEIVGTLLEAASPGRSFPTFWDTVALLMSGRHARAARNRRLSLSANLRLSLLFGTVLYLSDQLYFPLLQLVNDSGGHTALWLAITGAVLYPAVLLVPWLGRWEATTVLVILTGAVLTHQLLTPGPPTSHAIMMLARYLIPLGALAALSGGPVRLPRSWAWLLGVAPVALTAAIHLAPMNWFLSIGWQLPLAVVVTCWLLTDARPAFAFVTAQLLAAVLGVLFSLSFLGTPFFPSLLTSTFSLPLFAGLAVMLPAGWLLRRQTVPGPLSPP